MENYLKKIWNRCFRYDWKLGLFLILLFGIPRFALVLHSYVVQSYGVVMFVFVCMWFVPFVLLTKAGRRGIGMRRPRYAWRLVPCFLAGGACCLAVFGIFNLLFGGSVENAFAYIGGNNPGSAISGPDKLVYFWIAVIPSMLFSPIGEEFLYRGVIHGTFAPRFGERIASVFDSLAFALTHIAHFGLIYAAGKWLFLPGPAALWVLSMFVVCRVFFFCKVYSDSLWGAVIAHSGFNFVMMYSIFYLL